MQPLITQLPEVGTGKPRSPTSNISCSEVWTQETMQLRTVCDKCLFIIIREFWSQNFYRHSADL